MTREEFNRKNGSSFFVEFGKWGHQMTTEEISKAGFSLTTPTAARTTKSGISITANKLK